MRKQFLLIYWDMKSSKLVNSNCVLPSLHTNYFVFDIPLACFGRWINLLDLLLNAFVIFDVHVRAASQSAILAECVLCNEDIVLLGDGASHDYKEVEVEAERDKE
jgi:hypothetical protein